MPDLVEAVGHVSRADEGFTTHGGIEPRGLTAVPKSPLFEGRFGRMFRNLPIPVPPREALIALGKALAEPGGSQQDNPKIPAAYTYLGQFIDHDITFDPVSNCSSSTTPTRSLPSAPPATTSTPSTAAAPRRAPTCTSG